MIAPSVFHRYGLLVVAAWIVLSALPSHAQTITSSAQLRAALRTPPALEAEEITPRGALWRALVLPGWGQAYNDQLYKLPFVVAGFAGIGYAAYHYQQRYDLYRQAALYRQCTEGGDAPCEPEWEQAYRDEYESLLDLPGQQVTSRAIRTQRDQFRRNRDLSAIGLGLFYGLTVLDAYVNAHLADFDVDEDLTATVTARPSRWGAALRVQL